MNKALASIGMLVGLACAPSVYAADYTIDADHSTVEFKVKHLAISSVAGKFTEFQGNFSYDPAKVAESKAEATIAIKSVNTNQAKRDAHLRGEEFFDETKFPSMKFVSKSVKAAGSDHFTVAGDLTIRDVTKPVTLDVTYGGAAKDPWGNERAAFTATTKINRKDFGITWNKVLETGGLVVGDEVNVTLEVEGIKASEKKPG